MEKEPRRGRRDVQLNRGTLAQFNMDFSGDQWLKIGRVLPINSSVNTSMGGMRPSRASGGLIKTAWPSGVTSQAQIKGLLISDGDASVLLHVRNRTAACQSFRF